MTCWKKGRQRGEMVGVKVWVYKFGFVSVWMEKRVDENGKNVRARHFLYGNREKSHRTRSIVWKILGSKGHGQRR